jgi:maltose/moltooligosaccharide transporter
MTSKTGMRKLTLKLILLTVLPASMLELVNNIYNLYVPIYLQAGGAEFSKSGALITFGFGVGAFFVGFWLAVDNVLAFLFAPIVGAWSDRKRTRLGRRLPFVLATLPFIVIGYFLIPIIPTRIPAELNGEQSSLMGLFILFLGACAVYFLGFVPVRAILQTLRQEAVSLKDRSKIESWYIFIVNALTVFAYLYGRKLYAMSGPLIFWLVLGFYVLSAAALLIFYKEPEDLVESAQTQEKSNWKQIKAIIQDVPARIKRNLLLFLGSVILYSIVLGAFLNFTPSWVVVVLGANETKAAGIMGVLWVAATLAPIPAGYLGATKFGRRNLYLLGLVVTAAASIILFAAPGLYPIGLAGLGAGMSIALTGQLPLASEVTYNKNALGTLVGVYNFIYMLGFLLGANGVGLIIQMTSYRSLFPVLGGCGMAAAALAFFIRTDRAVGG